MSPQLRSMLEDAADDSGRPTIDLEGIRAAGRRAVWRRRGIAGGLGVGVTAVITTVAVTIGTGGLGPTEVAPSAAELEAAGISASAEPLIAAIEAAGYEVDLGDTGASGVGESSGSGDESGGSSGASGTTIPLRRDGTSGALRLTEFSSFDALVGLASGGAAVDESDVICAMPPPVSEDAGFAWGSCESEGTEVGTLASVAGTGTDVEAIATTVTLADGTGFSVTLATAPIDGRSFRADFTTPPTDSPLTALPLTAAELADVMAEIAADGGSLLTTEPLPDADNGELGPCVGEVIAELSDEFGRTELLDSQGQQIVCSFDLESDFPVDVTYVSELTPFDPPLAAWQFGGGLLTFCGGTGVCTEGMLSAVGLVPDGVTRITFEPVDGPLVEATIVDGYYFARVAPSLGDNSVLAPTIVRVYDAAGTLLLEGDASAPGGPTV